MIFALASSPGRDGMAPPSDPRVRRVDAYDLADPDRRAEVFTAAGLTLSGLVDQLLLASLADELTQYVRGGGRVLVNGHVVEPFIEGLSPWRKLDFHHPDEVRPHRLGDHPVFDGVDFDDLHFRTGVPGTHSHAELRRIGVAGFYGRGYHPQLPEGAVPITGVGPFDAVLDYSYSIGAGEVLVHGGLDLEGFSDERYTTGVIATQLYDWLDQGTGLAGQTDEGTQAA